MLRDEPLTRDEQLFLRAHLREVSQVVGFVVAVNLTAIAAGCVLGRVLGTAIGTVHNALQRRRS